MRTPRKLWLLLAGCLALTPCVVRAEGKVIIGKTVLEPVNPHPMTPGQSHVPLPPGPGSSADTERLFQDRFGRSEGMASLRKLLGNDLEQLLQDLKSRKIDPNDKDFKKHLEEALRKGNFPSREHKPTPEEIEAARRLLEGMVPKDTKLPIPDPKKDPPVDTTPINPTQPDKVVTPTPPIQPAETKPVVAAEEDWRARFSEWLMKQSKDGDLGKALDESPALRELVRDLARSLAEASINSSDPEDGDTWLGKAFAALSGLELPKGGSPPEIRPGPSLSSSSGSSTDGIGERLVWLLIGSATVIVLCKLLTGRLGWLGGKADEGWRLGPWPVRPESVATREELVRGFDYLSLLLLGRKARSWNHREIAGKLGGSVDEKRRAAVELAAVYEKARYAPDDEPLDEAAIATARRDLCYLAGVGGA